MNKFVIFLRKNTLAVGLTVIVVTMGTILFVESIALSRLQKQAEQNQQITQQIAEVTDRINRSATDRTKQLNRLNRHMDCIVLFFTAKDRVSKTISDIDTCTLQSTDSDGVSTQSGLLIPSEDTATIQPAMEVPQYSSAATVQPSPTPPPPPPAPSPTPEPTPVASASSYPTPQPAPTPPAGPAATTQPSFIERTIIQPVRDAFGAIF